MHELGQTICMYIIICVYTIQYTHYNIQIIIHQLLNYYTKKIYMYIYTCGSNILGNIYCSFLFIPTPVRSYGIIIWEVCTFGDHPYPRMTDENVIELLKTARRCNMENPAPPSDPAHSLYVTETILINY